MNTSAVSTSPRSACVPASVCRSSTTLRLPRLTLTNTPLMPGAGPTEMYRVLSPCGGSTLITSAPMSAMICVQYGPITIAVRSITRTPVSGPLGMVHLLGGQREAIPNVVAGAGRHDGEDDGVRRIADRVDVFADFLDRPRWPIDARRFRDDGSGHPAGQRDQYFPRDRAGFVREPAHHGRHQPGSHRRIRRRVDTFGHSRYGCGNDHV